MAERTPLYSALLREAEKKNLRMHMPGHKGKRPGYFAAADLFALDMTELEATGNLYQGLSPISDAERRMAEAAGAPQCFFLPGGSTQGIMAAMAAVCPPGSRVIVDRGCHLSVFFAMAHLDLRPVYLYRRHLEPWGITGPVTSDLVEKLLSKTPDASAVILTSPTYYGVISDLSSVAAATAKRRVPLIVDEAHGAHLPFLNGYRSAVGHGAALSVASAHKTLPALTAGALLYADASFDPRDLRRWTAMFGTSSPSYPVMASIDLARAYLMEEGKAQYERVREAVAALRREINVRGRFRAAEDGNGLSLDPTRLTVSTAAGGISGYGASKLLEERYSIICELADAQNIVCILTCADSEADIDRLGAAILALEDSSATGLPSQKSAVPPRPVPRLSPREAIFAPRFRLPLRRAAGKVAAEPLCPYPPGIPVVAAGEEIRPAHINYLKRCHFDLDQEIMVTEQGCVSRSQENTGGPKDHLSARDGRP